MIYDDRRRIRRRRRRVADGNDAVRRHRRDQLRPLLRRADDAGALGGAWWLYGGILGAALFLDFARDLCRPQSGPTGSSGSGCCSFCWCSSPGVESTASCSAAIVAGRRDGRDPRPSNRGTIAQFRRAQGGEQCHLCPRSGRSPGTNRPERRRQNEFDQHVDRLFAVIGRRHFSRRARHHATVAA